MPLKIKSSKYNDVSKVKVRLHPHKYIETQSYSIAASKCIHQYEIFLRWRSLSCNKEKFIQKIYGIPVVSNMVKERILGFTENVSFNNIYKILLLFQFTRWANTNNNKRTRYMYYSCKCIVQKTNMYFQKCISNNWW